MSNLFLFNFLALAFSLIMFSITRSKTIMNAINGPKHFKNMMPLIAAASICLQLGVISLLCVLCYVYPNAMLLINLYLVYFSVRPSMIEGMKKINVF